MKGLALPINILVIVAVAVIVLISLIAMYYPAFFAGSLVVGVDSAKSAACRSLVEGNACGVDPRFIPLENFDGDKNIEKVNFSNRIPANKLLEISGESNYQGAVKKQLELTKNEMGNHTFYINETKSDLIIGKNLPPPIIAEIVNCTQKDNENILTKVKYYIESGADIIDIGCVSNKPNPERIREIVSLIRSKFKFWSALGGINLYLLLLFCKTGSRRVQGSIPVIRKIINNR